MTPALQRMAPSVPLRAGLVPDTGASVEQTRSAYLQTGCPFTTAMVLPWRVSLRLRLNDLGRRRRRGRRRDVRRPALPDQGRGPSW